MMVAPEVVEEERRLTVRRTGGECGETDEHHDTGNVAHDGAAGFVNPGTDLCIATVIVPEFMRQHGPKFGHG